MGAGSSSLVRSQPSGGQSSKGGGQSSKGGGQNPNAGRTQVSQLNYMLNQPMQSPYRAPQTSYAYQPPTPQPPMAYIQPVPSPYGQPQQGMGGKGGFQQPATPAQPGNMSIDEFARSPLMGPTTMEFREPVQFEGGMYDPVLVRRYEQYRSGGSQPPGQRLAGQEYALGHPGDRFMPEMEISQRRQAGPTNYGPVPDSMRQMPVGGFGQPDQASMQAQMDALNQARQAGFQVGPTPNQPPNPYASMSVPQLQQMQQNAMRSPKGGSRPQAPQSAMRSSKGGGMDPRMAGGLAAMLTGRRMF